MQRQDALVIESNIDDMNPELYDHLFEVLFARGAKDVYLTPITMKKSRPAIKISIICDEPERPSIEEALWLNTTTFGLRVSRISKAMLKRDFTKIKTKFGEVSIKNAWLSGKKIKSKPEYEDCRRLAQKHGVSLKEILESIPVESDTGQK